MKKKLDLSTPNVEPSENNSAKKSNNGKKKAPANAKNNTKKRRSVGKFFRDIISELKKVEWAKFRSTKGNKGVLAQTGTVLVIVLIFIVIITAMDLGLSELLGLLIGAAA